MVAMKVATPPVKRTRRTTAFRKRRLAQDDKMTAVRTTKPETATFVWAAPANIRIPSPMNNR